ncbi:MAG: GNAT family N-acetyltransferase [Bdellovibrionales bacterium]|nr:GNAT family N-acetyltransferase [Bdellovibrionales bacterium]
MAHLKRESKTVLVRPLTLRDFAAWREGELGKLPRQSIWDSEPLQKSKLSKKRFEAIIAKQRAFRKDDRYHIFGVFEKATGHHIGYVSAMNVVRSVTQSAFLGYNIHNSHWRKGYAKEALRLFFDIAFTELKLHRLEAGIEPKNGPSIQVVKSLNLRKEGLKKRAVFLREKWQDLVIYSVTCEELGYSFRGNPRKGN